MASSTSSAPSPPPPPGIYVPVPTFFQSPTSSASSASAAATSTATPLDLATQARHSAHLARSGVRGLMLLGSTGEAVHLAAAERAELLTSTREAVAAAGFDGYPLLAGTATQSVGETFAQLRQARECGVRYGLCLVPGYFAGAVSQEGVARWFEDVAAQSPIPILIYHYPAVSNNVKVSISTYVRLAAHPNIVGCKLSHGDLSHHALIAAHPRIDHAGFAVFTGLGQQLLAALAVGCAGAIDGSAGFFPKAVCRLYELGARAEKTTTTTTTTTGGTAGGASSSARSREEEQAAAAVAERRLLQWKVSRVEELVVAFGTVAIKEAVSRELGMGARDGTRAPLFGGIPGGDAGWEKWEGAIAEMEKVEKSL